MTKRGNWVMENLGVVIISALVLFALVLLAVKGGPALSNAWSKVASFFGG